MQQQGALGPGGKVPANLLNVQSDDG